MENNSRFFENNKCEYFPCHKGLSEFNCLFCYCPFYAWEKCPGNNHFIEKPDGSKIKVCTDCTLPHVPQNYDFIMNMLKLGPKKYALSLEELPVKFYGIGVGPGEAGLTTVKAKQIMQKVDIIILPAKDRESCRAYLIAEQETPAIKQKECLFMPFPMSMKEPELSSFHQAVAKRVEEYLEQGKSVGFLTIGDVTVYSTFAYIEKIVRDDGYETESVNGITSFQAVAARLGIPLTLGSEELHIVPGSGDVKQALQYKGAVVFMKSGKKLTELKSILLEREKNEKIKVYAVSNCGLDNETISYGAGEINDDAGYLTVVIVKRG